MTLRFSKMHGLGNDFMVIETLSQPVNLTLQQIQQLSNRHTGVGFDQLLLISPPLSSDHDFVYRIYNANGEEVAQCGNGARCVGRYIRDKALSDKDTIKLLTRARVVEVSKVSTLEYSVDMGTPEFTPQKIPFITEEKKKIYSIKIGAETLQAVVLSMGNPHMVIIDDLADTVIDDLGPTLMKHAAFPEGVNVGFLKIQAPHNINLRVFERGVGETQACGSGACAAMVAGRMLGELDETVNVYLRGGSLKVTWSGEGSVIQTGAATLVYDGILSQDFLREI